MPSRSRTVSDRGRRRKDKTGGPGCGRAGGDGGSVPDESVRARDADGGDFGWRPRICQAEDSADRLAVAGSGTFAVFSGTCEGQAGVHGIYFWACAAARRCASDGAGLEKAPDGVEKGRGGFRGIETALAA